jgi:predicted RNA-binding Zn-ribbon protein involved in translation (DUF1610 family)
MKNLIFNLILILGFWVLFFSVYDIATGRNWMLIILILYAVLIILLVTLILYLWNKRPSIPYTVEEFEKRLTGGLYHFKCPGCDGIFAIKKSRGNNKKAIRMTCPDCGVVGIVPSKPMSVEEEIPEKKSAKANFRCQVCGEGVTVWAEGTELYKKIYVYTCPFCGEEEPLKRL